MTKRGKKTYDADSYSSVLPEKSVHQASERIFHRGGFEYDEVVGAGAAVLNGARLHMKLKLASGSSASFSVEVLSADVLRLNLTLEESSEMEKTSDMLVPFKGRIPGIALKQGESSMEFSFGRKTLVVDKSPFVLRIVEKGKDEPIFKTENYPLAGKPLVGALGFRRAKRPDTMTAHPNPEPYLSWSIRNGERFFGLGEKWNKVEKSSTRATIWASDTCGSNSNDMSYKSIPYLLSTAGWGIFLHSSFRSNWEIGDFSYVSGSCHTEDDKLDAFLFFGRGLKDLIGKYTELTGRPNMIPKWALGVWISRCMYEKQSQAEEAMDGFRQRGIPADVVHLDPLWMRTHYYFKIGVDACDFVRNDAAFPDLPGLWRKWRRNGFKTCLWVNPYLPEGSEAYEYAKRHNYILKSSKGGYARLSHGEPVGMVDFTNPAACGWWKGLIKRQLEDGAAVVKPDYGDRVPEDAIFANGRTGRELHNMYLFWFTRACYEACLEVHGYGLVWRRAGYIGSQRYPGTWAGDTRSTWEEMLACMRGGLSAGFNGDAFWAGDIGGFTGPAPSPELYIRWSQWGLLSPLARFHGANCPREPWHFGEKAVEVVRHYAKLRYRIMPYLLECANESCATGIPMMRHMHLEFPDDPGTEWIDDQFMLGPDLLVAPIFLEGARGRKVYLPTGSWVEFEGARKRLEGGRWHEVPAPLERIPIFARSGARIPTGSDVQFIP